MKISEGEGGGVVLLKEWSMHSLSRGLVIKLGLGRCPFSCFGC